MRIITRTRDVITVSLMVAAALFSVALFTRDAPSGPFYAEINGFVLDSDQPHDIPLARVAASGIERDGVPGISQPVFTAAQTTTGVPDGMHGIFVDFRGEKRFYPYNILAWHEVVNDQFGDLAVAITYYPISGTAAVYDRSVGGKASWFGVSGLMYESNTLLYDDQTESLWLQSAGAAVVGERTGGQLRRLPLQVLDFAAVKRAYPDALVLSTETGFARDYNPDAYTDYGKTESMLFGVSTNDTRLPAKTPMYIIPVGQNSVALERAKLRKNATLDGDFYGKHVSIHRNSRGEITAKVDGEAQPGYYELWFAWAALNQRTGQYWQVE